MAQAILQLMALFMAKAPPGTPLTQAISKAHTDIGKHIEPAATTSSGVGNALKSAMMQRSRMQPQVGAQATQAGVPAAAITSHP